MLYALSSRGAFECQLRHLSVRYLIFIEVDARVE